MMRHLNAAQASPLATRLARSAAIMFSSLALALSHASCGDSPATPYESDDGVMLTCPEGWSISEDHANEIGGRYLQLDEASFDSSGLVIINWAGEVFERASFLEDAAEGFLATYQDMFGLSGLESVEPTETQFGAHPALRVDYSFRIMGIEHRGALYVLNASEKTFLIIKQEGLEDQEKNLAGFEVIEATFRCLE